MALGRPVAGWADTAGHPTWTVEPSRAHRVKGALSDRVVLAMAQAPPLTVHPSRRSGSYRMRPFYASGRWHSRLRVPQCEVVPASCGSDRGNRPVRFAHARLRQTRTRRPERQERAPEVTGAGSFFASPTRPVRTSSTYNFKGARSAPETRQMTFKQGPAAAPGAVRRA